MTPTNSDNRGRVLYADDDRAAREGVAEMLRRFGFSCDSAGNAAEALANLQAAPYEALISDIHMPGNAGLELVATAAQAFPGLPVILLTGRPSVETAARSVRLPVKAYLTKPPDLAELSQVLDQAIAEYRELNIIQTGRQRLRNWEQELRQIEQLIKQPTQGRSGAAMEDYIRVSLRQAIQVLADLERATQSLEGKAKERLRLVDHVAALRHTVQVLERTRQNFKSKELADLRRQIEILLENDPASGAGI